MRRIASRHIAATLLAALAIHTPVTLAEDFVESSDETILSVADLVAQPIPTEFCIAPLDARIGPASSSLTGYAGDRFARDLEPADVARFEQTDGALDRLISAKRLELLTFMKSDSTALFFGVNEKGRLGLHLDASRLMQPDN